MSTTELLEKVGELTHGVTELKSVSNKKFEEIEQKGIAQHETLQTQENMMKDLDTKLGALEKRLARKALAADAEKGEELEMKSINDMLASANQTDFRFESIEDYQEKKSSVDKYLRTGPDSLTDLEKKSINGIVAPNGGYLVAPERSTSLSKRRFDGRAVQLAVTSTTIGTDTWIEPFDNDDYDDAEWEDQITDTGTDKGNNDFREVKIVVGDLYYPKKFSRSVLQDSYVNLETEVMSSINDGVVRKCGDGVLNGIGVTEDPFRGILTYDAGTDWGQIQQITSTVNDALDFDDVLEKLPANLEDDYHGNASFFMRRASFFSLITQKDDQSKYQIGNQIQFFSDKRVPLYLLGYPVLFDAGMPAVADGALAVGFGDLAAAYRKVDRIGYGIHRDDSNAKFITLTGRKRAGGGVKDFRAVKLLVIQ